MKSHPNSGPEGSGAEERLVPRTRYGNRKLRNYLAANSVQIKVSVVNLILMALVVAIIIGVTIAPFYNDIFRIEELYARHYSAKFFLVVLERSSIALLAVFLLLFLNNVLISHKVCGPLNNFSNTFNKMADGDLSRKVSLRKYDFLRNEADQLNRAISYLAKTIEQIKNSNRELLENLERIPTGEAGAGVMENDLLLAKKNAADCNELLSRFKLTT